MKFPTRETCPACKGTGKAPVSIPRAKDYMSELCYAVGTSRGGCTGIACEDCILSRDYANRVEAFRGYLDLQDEPCPECKGTGKLPITEEQAQVFMHALCQGIGGRGGCVGVSCNNCLVYNNRRERVRAVQEFLEKEEESNAVS